MNKLSGLLASMGLLGCIHGAQSPSQEQTLSRVARTDMCSAVTLATQSRSQSEATGCGQRATYVRDGTAWRRAGNIAPGPGSAADKLPVCTQ